MKIANPLHNARLDGPENQTIMACDRCSKPLPEDMSSQVGWAIYAGNHHICPRCIVPSEKPLVNQHILKILDKMRADIESKKRLFQKDIEQRETILKRFLEDLTKNGFERN